MKHNTLLSASAVLLLSSVASASHKLHEHVHALHKRHHEHHARSSPEIAEHGVEIRSPSPETATAEVEKRDGQCQFPYGAGLVPVAPGGMNAGWAMSPDEPCKPGNYCPYACPPGQVMAQWDPSATSYSYPKSMVCQAHHCLTRANLNRTVDYTATQMAKYRNHSQTSHIVFKRKATSASPTKLEVSSPSVRLFCQATKLC